MVLPVKSLQDEPPRQAVIELVSGVVADHKYVIRRTPFLGGDCKYREFKDQMQRSYLCASTLIPSGGRSEYD